MHVASVILLVLGVNQLSMLPGMRLLDSDSAVVVGINLLVALMMTAAGVVLGVRASKTGDSIDATSGYSIGLVVAAIAHIPPAIFYLNPEYPGDPLAKSFRGWMPIGWGALSVFAVASRLLGLQTARVATYAASILNLGGVPIGTGVSIWWLISVRKREIRSSDAA